ncbi:MAG: M14 family zinc carboxypeptidase [Candidatus Paceibacterota bacterium]
MKKPSRTLAITLVIAGLLAIAAGVYLLLADQPVEDSLLQPQDEVTTTPVVVDTQTEIIGTSVEGRTIESYTYGAGDKYLLFVGGIHGGYEWNSVLLAYQLMDYLEANPQILPDDIAVSVIPVLNPDGLYAVVGKVGRFTAAEVSTNSDQLAAARFNANAVDLNRNFDCNWAPESTWRGEKVSAGTSAFSEPEARALRDHVFRTDPAAAVFFHSAAGAVYGASCSSGLGPGTKSLLDTYAAASGYRAVDLFTVYPITGAVEDWLTSLGIPAVSVELTNHTDVEWEKNRAGIEALLNFYSQQ